MEALLFKVMMKTYPCIAGRTIYDPVFCEQYDRSRYDEEGGTGISIIFKSGFYCGYSMSELDSFVIEVTDKRIPALENYAFINVFRLRDYFMDGKFYEAFKSE